MNIAENDSIEANWHFRVLNRCDEVLDRLATVMSGLRSHRRRNSMETVSLAIYQEAFNQTPLTSDFETEQLPSGHGPS